MNIRMAVATLAMLLTGASANASQILLTAAGTTFGSWDQSQQLPTGLPMSITWLLDLDLAGPNTAPAELVGLANYDGIDPNRSNWITTLGVIVDGVDVYQSNFLSNSPGVKRSDHMGVDDHFNANWQAINMSHNASLTNEIDLGDGTSLNRYYTQGTYLSVYEQQFDFLNGTDLDQSFVWQDFDHPQFADYSQLLVLSTCELTAPYTCLESTPINKAYVMNVNTLIAQKVAGSVDVPEPRTDALLAMGLLGVVFARFRRRLPTPRLQASLP